MGWAFRILMGKCVLKGQVEDEVFAHFGNGPDTARQAYIQFIIEGVDQGRRPELVGGGMKRSMEEARQSGNEPESYD